MRGCVFGLVAGDSISLHCRPSLCDVRCRTRALTSIPDQHMRRHMPSNSPVNPRREPERHVRLLRSGRNRALRIPREFELEGDEAILRKEGDRLVIEPIRQDRLLALLAALGPIEEPFPDVDEGLGGFDDVQRRRCRFVICWTPTSFRT